MYGYLKAWSDIDSLYCFADHQQAYIAARLVHQKTTKFWRVCQADPGQGKTIIMILIAYYYIQENEGEPVIIAYADHLVKQLREHLMRFSTQLKINL